jgi:[NiFe] hydrogenase diaphorase moiety small subunit
VLAPRLSRRTARAASALVKVNGRTVAACTTPAAPGMDVRSDTPELNAQRKTLLQMLFVEGNHFCPSCEKSGNCQLQATAYEMGMKARTSRSSTPTGRWTPATPTCCSTSTAASCASCACAPAATSTARTSLPRRPRHRHAPVVNSPSGRLGDSDMAVDRPRRRHLPGGRDPAQARGFAVPIGERRYDRRSADLRH